MLTDPLADMLTRIRNANKARFDTVDIPHSRLKASVAKLLKQEGYIKDYKAVTGDANRKVIRISLRYGERNRPVIGGLKRVSKPSLRIYVGKEHIPSVMSGLGLVILSTSKGVVTQQEARNLNVGGEVLCYVW